MTTILVDDVLTLSGHGITMHNDAVRRSPEFVHDAIRKAFAIERDEYLQNAWSGGSGPLVGKTLTYTEFLQWRGIQDGLGMARTATRSVKTTCVARRRRQYDGRRDTIVLRMLAEGGLYQCVYDGCGEVNNLTVDHILPLSKGGTDELNNLQFLCKTHNSAKGDRLAT